MTIPSTFGRRRGRIVRLVAATATLVGLSLAAGCSNDDLSNMPAMGSSASPATSSSSVPAEFNDADVTFAQMMIPHHQQAVAMSDMILAKDGVDPQVAKLAEQIKQAQQPEIDTMTGWLTAWGKPTNGGMSGMDHGGDGGMMSEEQMQQLRDADGTSGQRLFLEGMIAHHQGAVTMAQDEIANGTNPDAVTLAENIVKTQNAEIASMKALLQQI
jgi:uncharacterized protein (DUF305 family)